MTIAKEGKEQQELNGMKRAKTHPILIVAGIAVLLFSLLGAVALTGVMPGGEVSASTHSERL